MMEPVIRPPPLTLGSYEAILPFHFGFSRSSVVFKSSGESVDVLIKPIGMIVLNSCKLISPEGSRNHGPPLGHTVGSTTSGNINTGLSGSSHLFGRNVP